MTNEIAIGQFRYRAAITNTPAVVRETGPTGTREYRIEYAIGGKDVFQFLTLLERGMWQTLPVAYDVRRQEWYDITASALHHFPRVGSEPIRWTERSYTFNTACYNCHVSQLAHNYDAATDTYHTTWREPGINCEVCHGAGAEHVRVWVAAVGGKPPADLKIISTKRMTPAQRNDLCATCHAKMEPLTDSYAPGDRYFDHFGLAALEDRDLYADGRDFGENFTLTGWLMNPCAKAGKLDCLHCHTSSGRFRFRDDPNASCLPCHGKRVKDVAAHSHHKPGSAGSNCLDCHMPKTEFGRIVRSDHSLRPPMPAATLAFHSPNACNPCHTDRDAAWADKSVRQWHPQDYQAATLYWAGLIDAARRHDWQRLPDMLAFLSRNDRKEVVATGLIRLLDGCYDDRKWPALRQALGDPSPLVRSAAARALQDDISHAETRAALLRACGDDYRIVRVNAAAALAALPRERLDEKGRAAFGRALGEYEIKLHLQPDSSMARFNLGNHYISLGQPRAALKEFEFAAQLDPLNVPPLVNASLLYARLEMPDKAESALRRAVQLEPENALANFNLGLLLAERNQPQEAEQRLRAALQTDPTLAAARYNLAVLIVRDRPDEAIQLCRQAVRYRPDQPRYGYTLAFFQWRKGDLTGAADTLRAVLRRHPGHFDSIKLLGEICERQNKPQEAITLYRQALQCEDLTAENRDFVRMKLQTLSGSPGR